MFKYQRLVSWYKVFRNLVALIKLTDNNKITEAIIKNYKYFISYKASYSIIIIFNIIVKLFFNIFK